MIFRESIRHGQPTCRIDGWENDRPARPGSSANAIRGRLEMPCGYRLGSLAHQHFKIRSRFKFSAAQGARNFLVLQPPLRTAILARAPELVQLPAAAAAALAKQFVNRGLHPALAPTTVQRHPARLHRAPTPRIETGPPALAGNL